MSHETARVVFKPVNVACAFIFAAFCVDKITDSGYSLHFDPETKKISVSSNRVTGEENNDDQDNQIPMDD